MCECIRHTDFFVHVDSAISGCIYTEVAIEENVTPGQGLIDKSPVMENAIEAACRPPQDLASVDDLEADATFPRSFPPASQGLQENETIEAGGGREYLASNEDPEAGEMSDAELNKRLKSFRLLNKALSPISFLFDSYEGQYWFDKSLDPIFPIFLSWFRVYLSAYIVFFSVTGTGSWLKQRDVFF